MGLFRPDPTTILSTSDDSDKVLKALASPKAPHDAMALVLANPHLGPQAVKAILATRSREQVLELLDLPRMKDTSREQLMLAAVYWVGLDGQTTHAQRLETVTRIVADNAYECTGLAPIMATYARAARDLQAKFYRMAGTTDPAPTPTSYQMVFDALGVRINSGHGTELLAGMIAAGRAPGPAWDKDDEVHAWHHTLRAMPVTGTGLRSIQAARAAADEPSEDMAWLEFLARSLGWDSVPPDLAVELVTACRVLSLDGTYATIDLACAGAQYKIVKRMSVPAKAAVLAHLSQITGAPANADMTAIAAVCAAAAPCPRTALEPWLADCENQAYTALLDVDYPVWQIPECRDAILEGRLVLPKATAWKAMTGMPEMDGDLLTALAAMHGPLTRAQTQQLLSAGSGDLTIATGSPSRIEAILRDPNVPLTNAQIDRLARNPEPRIAAAAAATGRASAGAIGELALSIDPAVLAGIAVGGRRAPATSEAYSAHIAAVVAGSTTNADVLANLLEWRSPPGDLLAALAANTEPLMRATAASAPALAEHPDLILTLSRDPDTSVALALAANTAAMSVAPPRAVDNLVDDDREDDGYLHELAEALTQLLAEEEYDAAVAGPRLRHVMARTVTLPGAVEQLAGLLCACCFDTPLLGVVYEDGVFDEDELSDIDVGERDDGELAALAADGPLVLREWLAGELTAAQPLACAAIARDPELAVRHKLVSRPVGTLTAEALALLESDPVPAVRALAARHASGVRPRPATGEEL